MIGWRTILAGGSRDIIVLNDSLQVRDIIQRNLRCVQRVLRSVLHFVLNCECHNQNCTKVLCQSFASNKLFFPHDICPHQILKPSKDHSSSFELPVALVISFSGKIISVSLPNGIHYLIECCGFSE